MDNYELRDMADRYESRISDMKELLARYEKAIASLSQNVVTATSALKVISRTGHIEHYLNITDPKALMQVRKAIADVEGKQVVKLTGNIVWENRNEGECQ